MAKRPTGLDDLPSELQEIIFSRINRRNVYHFLFQRRTHDAAHAALFAPTIHLKEFDEGLSNLESLLALIETNPSLVQRTKTIKLEWIIRADDQDPNYSVMPTWRWEALALELAHLCPNLEVLDIETESASWTETAPEGRNPTGVVERHFFPHLREVWLRGMLHDRFESNISLNWLSIDSGPGIAFHFVDATVDDVDKFWDYRTEQMREHKEIFGPLHGWRSTVKAREVHFEVSSSVRIRGFETDWDMTTAPLADMHFTHLEKVHIETNDSQRSEHDSSEGAWFIASLTPSAATLRSIAFPCCDCPWEGVEQMREALAPFTQLREFTFSISRCQYALDMLAVCPQMESVILVVDTLQSLYYGLQGLAGQVAHAIRQYDTSAFLINTGGAVEMKAVKFVKGKRYISNADSVGEWRGLDDVEDEELRSQFDAFCAAIEERVVSVYQDSEEPQMRGWKLNPTLVSTGRGRLLCMGGLIIDYSDVYRSPESDAGVELTRGEESNHDLFSLDVGALAIA